MNTTPKSERLHIGIFGKRNAGKSSLINAITGQSLAIVSSEAGTTTDPVYKAMEILPIGPVMLIDTAGLDDAGELGKERIAKTYEVLSKTDIALIVTADGIGEFEKNLERELKSRAIPYLIVHNKCDVTGYEGELAISAKTGEGIDALKNRLAEFAPKREVRPLVSDLIEKGDVVVLVVPIDESAPKGRLILPQQQTIRDILDNGATAFVCQPSELEGVFSALAKKPRLVICDSQAFGEVEKKVPRDIPLTSFSILFARYKGDLDTLVKGVNAVKELKEGDRVLISEGCTHHRQCGDIGSVKIPRLLEKVTGVKPSYDFTSGGEFTKTPQNYKLIIHCGGCMLIEREMQSRLDSAKNTPIVNYGVLLSYLNGILERSLEPFSAKLLDKKCKKE